MAKGKVLVTGGTGYIGSHTVVELQNAGYDVVIVDNLSNSNISVLDGIFKISGIHPEFEQFDLTEKDKCLDFFKRHRDIKAIVHFAAFKAVGESVDKPLLYYQNNLISLLNILESMATEGIQNIVFSSSCTVYGEPDQLPVTENAPVKKANSPYGNTKQISEEIIQDTITSNPSINCISLRYFNPIGAHESVNIGELPLGVPLNLVPFVTQTAAGVRKQLSVFGNDYNTPDGTCVRDYIHVTDLALAHVVAIDRLVSKSNKKGFEIFNLGTGKGATVLEVIKTFEKATGVKLNYTIVGRRSGDVEKVWADTNFANVELKWKAQLSLENALQSAWKWEKKIRKIE